ncbi:M24 family metallopeptidase [Pseudogemmobacter bohemicus]|uniref:M24 family metallopeptidase n=1 Tax=Pseudogemmobacter bohemicus TaxID=2250708 RepID=UPI001E2F8091|nr:Xaa-Pro peptidase family protein [Pseudogemmobacter bohemicus]
MGQVAKGRVMDFDKALHQFQPVQVPGIGAGEYAARVTALQARMLATGVGAVWLDASSSLRYFLGHSLGLSERIHGALIPARGAPVHISPVFEEPKLRSLLREAGRVAVWEEDEDPYALIAAEVAGLAGEGATLALDQATPWLFAAPLLAAMEGRVVSAQPLISGLRQVKSAAEIAIIQTAMSASHQVQKAVWQGLRAGISTTVTCAFITAAHKAQGMSPLFAAAQFGEATAYPHGVPEPQILADGDMVLIDLGATLHGYCSDITRTYVFGTPTPRQRALWGHEQAAHAAAFAAAQIGAPCEAVDAAARASLEAAGFGPGYRVPGLPHRTGHGLGMDIHEEPFIVKGNRTPLEPGMCFSVEPMLCLYGECGIRLEDIAFMTPEGPHWFCPPSVSLDRPFG